MSTAVQTSFLERLKVSRLLKHDQIAGACEAAGEEEPYLSRHLVAQGLLTRFQARQLRAGATAFSVDKYTVLDFIGRGGNSVVYKARHRHMPNRTVALKTVSSTSLHQDADALERFRQEISIVAHLDHPNIVRAYDVILRRNEIYLVLEYVEGCDLAQLVAQFGPLPIPDATDYALQAARALAYAHRSGIVHRDVKPANLLLARNGIVKLADLGLAQFHSRPACTDAPVKGTCMGTPDFMAPEQAENATHADARSDLYSLGATLFHLLTGELPVKGNTYFHKLQHLLSTPPKPLAEARPDVPPALAELVDGLRARQPEERPANAEEVVALLEPFARRSCPDSDPRSWDGRRKASLILQVVQGKISMPEACAPHGLTHEEFERWRQRFLEGAAHALDSATAASPQQDTLRALYAKIGAQAMEIELLKSRLKAGNGSVISSESSQPQACEACSPLRDESAATGGPETRNG